MSSVCYKGTEAQSELNPVRLAIDREGKGSWNFQGVFGTAPTPESS